ncbi:BPTI/Kunitz domain-containing protein [Rhipicephalus sanguineus]|nr:BPTI/Kunitz domain-containing protein [Rhipicephalus sanguineus]
MGLCARGRNRFSSMTTCRRKCIDGGNGAAPECYQRAIFEECQRRDVLKTWWYSDGRACRRWHFPRGLCPSDGALVFHTSSECARRCGDRRRPCRVPKTVQCNATHLRFSYFADPVSKGSRSRRCRRVPAAGGDKAHLCLNGANRFRTMDACREKCKHARH